MAQSAQVVRLDSCKLSKMIADSEFKIYWLAIQIKVDRKTISRWINGKVKWIKQDNLVALARELDCDPESLSLAPTEDEFASEEEQVQSAKAIIEHNLLEALSGSSTYQLAEKIIKGLLLTSLPSTAIAELYLELGKACWQQNKYSIALEYLEKTLQIANSHNLPELALEAQVEKATILSILRRLEDAQDMIECALDNPLIESDPFTRATLYLTFSNNAMFLGDFRLARTYRDMSIETYEEGGKIAPWRHAVIAAGACLCELLSGNYLILEEILPNALQLAEAANYQRGMCFVEMIQARLIAEQGHHQKAKLLFEQAYSAIENGDRDLYDYLGYSIYKKTGDLDNMSRYQDRIIKSDSPVFKEMIKKGKTAKSPQTLSRSY